MMPIGPLNLTHSLIFVILSPSLLPADPSVVNAIGLIIAHLPGEIYDQFVELISLVLNQPGSHIDSDPMMLATFGSYRHIANQSSLWTPLATFISLFHFIANYGRIRIFKKFRSFLLRNILQHPAESHSIYKLFFICQLIAPFIYRISFELLLKIIHNLFEMLLLMDPYITSLASQDPESHPLQMLDVIINFLFHCKFTVRGLPRETNESIARIICQFSPFLLAKFRYWCTCQKGRPLQHISQISTLLDETTQ